MSKEEDFPTGNEKDTSVTSESAEDIYDIQDPADTEVEDKTEEKGEQDAAETEEEDREGESTEGEDENVELVDADLLVEAEALGLDRKWIESQPSKDAVIKGLLKRSRELNTAEDKVEEEEEVDFEIDEKNLDPEVVEQIKALKEFMKAREKKHSKQVEELTRTLQSFDQQLKLRDMAAFEDEFDKWINSEEMEAYRDEFGSGTGDELDMKSKEFENRIKLMKRIDTFLDEEAKDNQGRRPRWNKVRQAAVDSLHGKKREEKARKEIAKKMKKRGGQFVTRTTGRRTPVTASPDALAEDFVKDFMQKKGIEPEGSPTLPEEL
jgi:hypothetical protein